MFSGEALDATAHIARQLACYVEGYAVLAQVYNAYEAVYGAQSLTESRRDMQENLTGTGNPFGLSTKYFQQYRLVFVGKSNTTRVRLSYYLHVEKEFGYNLSSINDIPKNSPGCMTGNPLSAGQVKDLAAYCKAKNTTLFEFLVNKMKFLPVIFSDTGFRLCPFYYTDSNCKTLLPDGADINRNSVYLATGAQSYDRQEAVMAIASAMIGGYMQGIKMTEVGATDTTVKFFTNSESERARIGYSTVLFFVKY